MRGKRVRAIASVLVGLAYPMVATQAAGLVSTLSDIFSINGFGTLSEVHSSERLAAFTDTFVGPHGAGYPNPWSAEVDSLLGVQLNARILPTLSAVVQAVAQQNYDGTYRPGIEWANLKYQPIPDLSVRLGRTVLPTFMAADDRQVGYANSWVRPPPDVYDTLPITHSDGVDLSYRLNVGDLDNTWQAYYGDNNVHFAGGSFQARDLWGLSDTAEYGHLTLHASFQELRLTAPQVTPFFDAFVPFGPQGIAIADAYGVDNKRSIIKVLGAGYDPGRWFLMSEWAENNTGFFLGRSIGWYVTAGFRYWQLTPYATYSARKVDAPAYRGLNLALVPPALQPEAIGLNAALNFLFLAIPVETTTSIGARWDFYRNLDLKLQYDHLRLGPNSDGLLSNVQPGFRPGSSVSLINIAVDFVF